MVKWFEEFEKDEQSISSCPGCRLIMNNEKQKRHPSASTMDEVGSVEILSSLFLFLSKSAEYNRDAKSNSNVATSPHSGAISIMSRTLHNDGGLQNRRV